MILAPLFAWSWRIASNRCCSSTVFVDCILASRTASLRMFEACVLSTSSCVLRGCVKSFSLTCISKSCLMDCMSMLACDNMSLTMLFLSRRSPSIRCSGPTERLASRAASSRLNARISDTFGENWLAILLLPFFLLLSISRTTCKIRAICFWNRCNGRLSSVVFWFHVAKVSKIFGILLILD